MLLNIETSSFWHFYCRHSAIVRIWEMLVKKWSFLAQKSVKNDRKTMIFDHVLKKYRKNSKLVRERLLYFKELAIRNGTTYILTSVGFGSEGFFYENLWHLSKTRSKIMVFGHFWPLFGLKLTIFWSTFYRSWTVWARFMPTRSRTYRVDAQGTSLGLFGGQRLSLSI